MKEAAGAAKADAALAARVAATMFARDRAAQMLGIVVAQVAPGSATCSMTVRDEMLNGHDICHGGILFTLADTAFAYACNSRNERTVALQCSISFAAPARAGERLSALAEERATGGRTGTYDVRVCAADGSLVALFRGTSYRVSGALV